jgi:sodium transport system permease protein
LGLVLGYAAYESRSLLPGVLMHFVNNALQMVLVRRPDIQGLFESWGIIGAGLVATAVGLWLLRGSGGTTTSAPPAPRLRPALEVHS